MNLVYNAYSMVFLITRLPVPRNDRVIVGFPLWISFCTPIELMVGDQVLVDPQTCVVEIVERAGIAIYRSGWLN
jgi:hypothetical protein